jgi:hypothetical protein
MAKSHSAQQADYDRLKGQGYSDEDALIKSSEITPKTTNVKKKSRASDIINRALGRWRKVKKPAALTQYRKYTNPTESE